MTDHSHSSREPTVQRERASLDELFEALSRPSRRRILTALAEADPRDEAEFASGDFTSDARRQEVSMRLHHTHLPKLEEAGFIEWGTDSKTITRGPRFDEIAPLVELMSAHRDELPVGWP